MSIREKNFGMVHTFNTVNNGTGEEELTEFHFDRVVTRREARRIVTKIEGHKLAKKQKGV
jgi:hypothetical protein